MLKVDDYTPKELKDTVYLHLKPTAPYSYQTGIRNMTVTKMSKTLDAKVEPGIFIVKLEVAVPKEFFSDSMPSARIELSPGQVVPVMITPEDEPDRYTQTGE